VRPKVCSGKRPGPGTKAFYFGFVDNGTYFFLINEKPSAILRSRQGTLTTVKIGRWTYALSIISGVIHQSCHQD